MMHTTMRNCKDAAGGAPPGVGRVTPRQEEGREGSINCFLIIDRAKGVNLAVSSRGSLARATLIINAR